MKLSAQLAKHLRDVHFGGNWTVSNVKEQLADVTWQEAITKVHDFNTIAVLTFHTNYFVGVASKVLAGGPLEGNDKFSFDHPPIQSPADWEALRSKALTDAEAFAVLIEQQPEEIWWEDFKDKKYGTYYRNVAGIIEHTHYHLGQIALIKKMVRMPTV